VSRSRALWPVAPASRRGHGNEVGEVAIRQARAVVAQLAQFLPYGVGLPVLTPFAPIPTRRDVGAWRRLQRSSVVAQSPRHHHSHRTGKAWVSWQHRISEVMNEWVETERLVAVRTGREQSPLTPRLVGKPQTGGLIR